MNKYNKKFNLNEKERSVKEELKKLGVDIQKLSAEPKERLSTILQEKYESVPENKWNKTKSYFKRPLILAPIAGLSVVVIFFFVMNALYPMSYTNYPYLEPASYSDDSIHYSNKIGEPKAGPASVGGGGEYGLMYLEKAATPSGLKHSSSPTFKDKFLNLLGSHQADYQDIADRGAILEKDLNVKLITTQKEIDVELFARGTFESLGGYVENINQSSYYSAKNKRLFIQGKIPADKIDALRLALKNFVGKDKYYQEYLKAVSRTADVIVIEEKIKEVEKSIEYLEDAIAREANPKKKQQLQKQLIDNKNFLAEREQTQEKIMERVDFVDVGLNLRIIHSFWRAGGIDDIRLLYSGFENASIWDNLIINVLHIIIIFLKILSYTFWIIPIIVWIIIKKKRQKKFLAELD